MEVLQKEYIEIRLDELVESTDCSTEFLDVFVSKGTFTNGEKDLIEHQVKSLVPLRIYYLFTYIYFEKIFGLVQILMLSGRR